MKVSPAILCLYFVLAFTDGDPQTAAKISVNREGAKNVIAASVAEAKKLNAPGAASAQQDEDLAMAGAAALR